MCKNNGLAALLEDDVHTGFAHLIDAVTAHQDELRHASHSIILALEALRMELRDAASKYRGDEDAGDPDLSLEADKLGTDALMDTLTIEQMSLDDVTVN